MNDNVKKDNRGYLYPNKNKNKPTQPDFTGKVMVDGKDWRISAWENQTPEGNKYLSLSFSLPLVPVGETSAQHKKQEPSNQIVAPISDDFDLDSILNSTDDENPFN
ncbi:hypothetical protein GW796_10465 [archaeon]|nr:hypothetical protein [archaeon]